VRTFRKNTTPLVCHPPTLRASDQRRRNRNPEIKPDLCKSGLIDDITSGDPHDGIGKPEPLKYLDAWSRRIDDQHRLVYRVVDGDLHLLQARYHYTR
jgi:Txe/YoeB family toxin of toxin-antitoxin system